MSTRRRLVRSTGPLADRKREEDELTDLIRDQAIVNRNGVNQQRVIARRILDAGPWGVVVDRPMTAADPVVPASAVEKALTEALNIHKRVFYDYEPPPRRIQRCTCGKWIPEDSDAEQSFDAHIAAALVPVVADIVAANTDTTDALVAALRDAIGPNDGMWRWGDRNLRVRISALIEEAGEATILDRVKADAWDEGFRDGCQSMFEDSGASEWPNPYRAALRHDTTTEGTDR